MTAITGTEVKKKAKAVTTEEVPRTGRMERAAVAEEQRVDSFEASEKKRLGEDSLLRMPRGSKKVIIRRRNTSRLPKEMYKDAITKISSEWKENTRTLIRGLNSFEEDKYLPLILHLQPDSPNWDRAVEDYWADFTIRVPDDGISLELWTDARGRPTESNVRDYIMYRFCQASSKVAVSDIELDNKAVYPFYIEDADQLTRNKFDRLQIVKKANLAFLKLFNRDRDGNLATESKIDWVLELYRREDPKIGNTYGLTVEEKEVLINEKVLETPEKFNAIIEDPNLEGKAFITKCMTFGLLNKMGNAIYNGEEKLGDNMDEAVYFLKDPKHSTLEITLKERLRSLESVKLEL